MRIIYFCLKKCVKTKNTTYQPHLFLDMFLNVLIAIKLYGLNKITNFAHLEISDFKSSWKTFRNLYKYLS